ncbi:molybdopterin-dependent oxidoreductase [Brevibacillus ruminantium]|uniref:Molybdopterin-dependent oxidoreductase n=1 Tax=Brevibacillus ruminantium TaxID=2950604 RepID=A0ABY4WKP9_9BACL|nr:molybdopterin-dependent oxidoreductase [Brevibacillus ruminantium]USG67434.1 molybdopterin-dependent oxidoreductase [Brevibacillus ruminantium]
MKSKQWYRSLHAVHAIVLLCLLATGACLYLPGLRSLLSGWVHLLRSVHIGIGLLYLLLLLYALVPMIRYLRRDPRWTKTFHVCLQFSLGLGWGLSGIYLWINDTNYLGLRQFASLLHDLLSLLIIPWVLGHIALWYARKDRQRTVLPTSPAIVPDQKGAFRTLAEKSADTPGSKLLTRREVILLFVGGLTSFLFGGVLRWFQPLTQAFREQLDAGKRRGYFRIYSVRSENPSFDPEEWRLQIDGIVKQQHEFTFNELVSLPVREMTKDFHCVTGWSVTQVEWKGVPFSALIEWVQPDPAGIYVKMYSADQLYTETYELSQLLQDNVLLAFELDGQPLSPQQGSPLRLVHPDMYGYKSIKWLNRIEFTEQRGLGYWEEKEGYDLNGYIT